MKLFRAAKFRVYPTPEQAETLLRWNGARRFLWNLCVEQRLMAESRPRGDRKHRPSVYDVQKDLTALRAQPVPPPAAALVSRPRTQGDAFQIRSLGARA